MNDINNILLNNMIFIIPSLIFVIIVLLVFLIVMGVKNSNFKKRVGKFLGSSGDRHNIEAMLNSYLHQVKTIGDTHEQLLNDINDINHRMVNCVQKVGLVRYNPFDDVGGDLSFTLALLNEDNDGVVINNLYARDNCYTYAKPVKDGNAVAVKFSDEEAQAVKEAIINKQTEN